VGTNKTGAPRYKYHFSKVFIFRGEGFRKI
jgi:hypothetical protein